MGLVDEREEGRGRGDEQKNRQGTGERLELPFEPLHGLHIGLAHALRTLRVSMPFADVTELAARGLSDSSYLLGQALNAPEKTYLISPAVRWGQYQVHHVNGLGFEIGPPDKYATGFVGRLASILRECVETLTKQRGPAR